MKKTMIIIAAMLVFTGATQGIEVLQGDTKPADCEALAEIRAGDLFNRYPKNMAHQSVVEDAEKMNAQKVSVQLIAHSHPKLGKSYSATGIAWKCVR